MNIYDFSRKVYKRICYSFSKKRILYVGISPKKRDKDLIKELESNNDLTTMDKELLRSEFGAEKHYVLNLTTELPFPDNYFDVVIMLGVIGYGLDDIAEVYYAFNNIKRILKEKGKVFFELTKEKEIIA